jgi:hypothetical protein
MVKRALVRIDVLVHERGEAALKISHLGAVVEMHGAHDNLGAVFHGN